MAVTHVSGKCSFLKDPQGNGRLPLTAPGIGPFGSPAWARTGAAPLAWCGRNSATFSPQQPLSASRDTGAWWRNDPIAPQRDPADPNPPTPPQPPSPAKPQAAPPGAGRRRLAPPPPLHHTRAAATPTCPSDALKPLPSIAPYTPVASAAAAPPPPSPSPSCLGGGGGGGVVQPRYTPASLRLSPAPSPSSVGHPVLPAVLGVAQQQHREPHPSLLSGESGGGAPRCGSSSLDWHDFAAAAAATPPQPASALHGTLFGSRVQSVFDGIDDVCSKDNLIETEELLRILRRPGEGVGARALYRELDANFDGQISREEWDGFFTCLLHQQGAEKVDNLLTWLEDSLGDRRGDPGFAGGGGGGGAAWAPRPSPPSSGSGSGFPPEGGLLLRGGAAPPGVAHHGVLRSRSLRRVPGVPEGAAGGGSEVPAGSWISCVDPFQVGLPPQRQQQVWSASSSSQGQPLSAQQGGGGGFPQETRSPALRLASSPFRSSFRSRSGSGRSPWRSPGGGSGRPPVSFDESWKSTRSADTASRDVAQPARNPFVHPRHVPFTTKGTLEEEELLGNLDIGYEESCYAQSMADGASSYAMRLDEDSEERGGGGRDEMSEELPPSIEQIVVSPLTPKGVPHGVGYPSPTVSYGM